MSREARTLDGLDTLLLEEAAARGGEHPGLDRLAEYHQGGLGDEIEERLRDHLVACRECADRLLEMHPLLAPRPGLEAGVADLELESGWRELRARLRLAEAGRAARARRRRNLTSAAVLGVVILGLGLWAERLRQVNLQLTRQLAASEEPVANLSLFYLDDALRGPAEDTELIRIPASASELVLVVPLVDEAEQFELSFLDARGSTLLRVPGLLISEAGSLRLSLPLSLPRRRLPPGDYRIRLRAMDDGAWREAAEYRRRIVYLDGREPEAG